VLGRDDFALRKGQKYGTVVVDLEERHLVDLFAVKRDYSSSSLTSS
jgi:hypothetical protein